MPPRSRARPSALSSPSTTRCLTLTPTLTLPLTPILPLTPTLTLTPTLNLNLTLTLYDEATALLARSARWVLPFFFTAWGCAVQSGRLQLLRDAPRAIIFLLPLYWAEVRVRVRD